MLIRVEAVAQASETLPAPVEVNLPEGSTLDDVLRRVDIPPCAPYAYVFNKRVCHHGEALSKDGVLLIVPICLGG